MVLTRSVSEGPPSLPRSNRRISRWRFGLVRCIPVGLVEIVEEPRFFPDVLHALVVVLCSGGSTYRALARRQRGCKRADEECSVAEAFYFEYEARFEHARAIG